MPLADGSHRIVEGWLDHGEKSVLFDVLPSTVSMSSKIIARNDISLVDKIMRLWNYWANEYDQNKLENAMRKECGNEITVSMDIKLSGEVPVSLVNLSGGVQGMMEYKFPKGYRYQTDYYEDLEDNSEIKILKTIKCKNNTNSDWLAERAVFVRGNDKFELFQDELSNHMNGYFDIPSASGPLERREKMIELRRLDNNKDYHTAFFKLNRYMNDNIYDDFNLNNIEKTRLNTIVIEQITQF